MTLSMTDEQWDAFALGLDETLTGIFARLEAAEAWICRRPNDAIPQVFIDQIRAEAIASVTPQVPEAPTTPDMPVDEEVPGGDDEDADVPIGG